MRIPSAILATTAAVALAACTSLFGPDSKRAIGIVQRTASDEFVALPADARSARLLAANDMELPVLEAPDTVAAGGAFDVVVRTYGSDGCWRAAGAKTSRTDRTFTITPYDEHRVGAGWMCTMLVVRLPRTVRVTFAHPGEGVLRVNGRKVLGDRLAGRKELTTIEKRIVIR